MYLCRLFLMKKDKVPLLKSESLRNISILLSGNALGQVVAFLATMVLTRIYAKEDFGTFALFMSTTTILSYIGTGRYEEAIVMAKNKRDALSLIGFIAGWLLIFSVFLFALLACFHQPILTFLNMNTLDDLWMLIPIMIFLVGVFLTLTSLSNREKRYKAIAGANLTQNTSSALTKIALNPLYPNIWGLLYGQIISYILACFAFFNLRKDIGRSLRRKWEDKKSAAWAYRDFPRYTMPRNILNSFSANLPFLLLTGVFGEAQLGLFFLASNTAFRPINLIVNSFYQVLYEKTTRLKQRNEKISPVINKYLVKNLMYMLPCFILIFVLAPQLFSFFFGAEWRDSGEFLRYIIPWYYMILFTTPLGFLPLLFGKQRVYMWIEILYFVFRVLGIYIGIMQNDFRLSIVLFSVVGFIFMSLTYVWYRWNVKKYEDSLL